MTKRKHESTPQAEETRPETGVAVSREELDALKAELAQAQVKAQEAVNPRLLEGAATAGLGTAIDQQDPLGQVGVKHHIGIPGSNAGHTGHGGDARLAQLAGSPVRQFADIGGSGAGEHQRPGFWGLETHSGSVQ